MTSNHLLSLQTRVGNAEIIVHPSLIEAGSSLILFDAGFPHQVGQITESLRNCGHSLEDLTMILISHQDHDHIGSLAALKRERPNVTVACSDVEAPFIDGREESLRIRQARDYNKNLTGDSLKWGESFLGYLQTIEPCPIDLEFRFERAAIADGVWILPTPGHTPGHLSIFLEDSQTFIAGDSLALENGRLEIANPQFTLDMHTCVETIRALARLNASEIICYHGGSIDNHENRAIRELLERIGREDRAGS